MQTRIKFLILLCFPLSLQAQSEKYALTLQEAAKVLTSQNPTLKMADKAVSIMRGERQKLNAFWYPMLNASGMVVSLPHYLKGVQPYPKH